MLRWLLFNGENAWQKFSVIYFICCNEALPIAFPKEETQMATLASDQDGKPQILSMTARRMSELRDEIFVEWEKRVRTSVKEADEVPRPLLVDTLPTFYDNITQAVSKDHPRATAVEGTSVAGEHGSERARLTKFDPHALITEYQVLRGTIFDVLHQQGVSLSHEEALVVHASLDAGIREAVNAYAMAQFTLRQQFIAALAHDLRGPLAVVSAALELILMDHEPARIKSHAVKAADNLRRMDSMIRSLLDSMSIQDGKRIQFKLEHFDIAELIKEVQMQFASTHDVRFQIFGGPAMGWWDRDALRRAIENLVGNAVKYGDMSKPIRISFAEAYERLILMVHNEGKPIPPEEQENIFKVFQRALAAKETEVTGWGIGLPFVRGVVENHGGSIAVDSAIDRGTTFTLDIPLDARPFQNAPAFGQKA
jgi:signal transduction histidine kinase